MGLAISDATQAETRPDRTLTWSGRCPIDVIFPLRVDADRAYELKLVPRHYDLLQGPDGKVIMVVSLLYCDETTVDDVAAGPAFHHDMLFQIQPPFGTATIPPDHQLDGYWSWLVTDDRRVHKALRGVGMHSRLDRRMRVAGTYTDAPLGTRLTSVKGRVSWPRSPFKLRGTVLDAGVPEGSDMRFWHDVRGGILRSRLIRPFGAELGSAAYYTLMTRVDSRLAKVLEGQCVPTAAHANRCAVSGPGFVTNIVGEFVHNIEVRPAAAW